MDRGQNGVEARMRPWRPDFVETKCGEEEPAGVETGDMLISTTKDFTHSLFFTALTICRLEANPAVRLVKVSKPFVETTIEASLTRRLLPRTSTQTSKTGASRSRILNGVTLAWASVIG